MSLKKVNTSGPSARHSRLKYLWDEETGIKRLYVSIQHCLYHRNVMEKEVMKDQLAHCISVDEHILWEQEESARYEFLQKMTSRIYKIRRRDYRG